MKKKIVIFSGKRGGFSHFVPILQDKNFKKKFKFHLILSDMHLSKDFGQTFDEVKKYFNNFIKLEKDTISDGDSDRLSLIYSTIKDLEKHLIKIKPFFIFLLGDRAETLAAAITSSYLKIPIIHFYGGDITQGGTDETARHAITKLSNIHIASSEDSKQNILMMGEEKWRVKNLGFFTFDLFKNNFFISKKILFKKFNILNEEPFIILIQHPVTWDPEKSKNQIQETINAIISVKIKTIAIYPCSDPGHKNIVKELVKTSKKFSFFNLYKNIELNEFYSLYKYSSAIIGNSSSGITESCFFKKAAINIGTRQEGRICSDNVIHVSYKKKFILKALHQVMNKKFNNRINKSVNLYGSGNSTNRLFEYLSKFDNKTELINKKFIRIK